MSRVRTAVLAAGLVAGTVLALPAPAQATGYLDCESGTSIFCNAPTDAASPGDEVWMVSSYPSGAYGHELTSYRNHGYANSTCTYTDRSHNTTYYFTLTYTDTSSTQQTVSTSAQCLMINP